jgi:hypothetical protein
LGFGASAVAVDTGAFMVTWCGAEMVGVGISAVAVATGGHIKTAAPDPVLNAVRLKPPLLKLMGHHPFN